MTNGEYYYKTITYRYEERELNFQVSQSLFSSYQIDTGTAFLLRTIDRYLELGEKPKILDVGCGYGPIGIVLKQSYPESIVHMVDRDALAVDFTRNNVEINNLDGVHTYSSLDFGNVIGTDFNLILSNIPAKVGTQVISRILLDAAGYLHPEGQVAIVVIRPLETLVDTLIEDNPHITVLGKYPRKGHIVYLYRFSRNACPAPVRRTSPFETNVYERDRCEMTFNDISYPMTIVYGLAEFDTYDYRTIMLIEMLLALNLPPGERVLVFNPGQGHIPVIIRHLFSPNHISISDRDLLGVETTRLNLIGNDFQENRITALNQVYIGGDGNEAYDLVTGIFRSDETDEANYSKVARAAELLSGHGRIIVSGTSTEISRLEKKVNQKKLLTTVTKKKSNRYSVIVLKKKG